MGLMVYSLDNVPKEAKRDYYIYLLDYGWDWQCSISDILNKNFAKMSEISAKNSVVERSVFLGFEAEFECVGYAQKMNET